MKYILSALAFSLFISCSNDKKSDKNTKTDYTSENEAEITAYIEEHNLTATKSSTGLYYVIDEEGTGEQPMTSSNVTVAYKGYFSNGSVFDQSDENGISFSLQGVI